MAKKPCSDGNGGEPQRIVCTATELLSEADAAPGSVRRHCMRCSAEVWVAPSSIRLLATGGGHIPLCVPCAVAEMDSLAAAGDEIKCSLAPGAREELEAWLRNEAN